MNTTVPLEEILPFSSTVPRSILVCDSIETDASFLLHTFARLALKKKPGQPVWWITAKPVTVRQVATALKKMGSEVAATYLRKAMDSTTVTGPLTITSLATEIADQLLLLKNDEEFDAEQYLKDMYRQIKTWLLSTKGDMESYSCCWLLLDDVSALASMVGSEVLVYQFVDSIQGLANRSQNLGLMIRCSLELDQMLLRTAQIDERHDKTGWLGAGGLAHKEERKRRIVQQDGIPWERMMECMDIVVDVVPLSSGYSREAHGRLIFSEYPGGRGWRGTLNSGKNNNNDSMGTGVAAASPPSSSAAAWNKFVINYCLQESGVRAIRLRENSTSK
jgi:hypothetical protein